ncbi:MAG: hypothetical protein ACFNME_01860 [Actinomyces dentalis]
MQPSVRRQGRRRTARHLAVVHGRPSNARGGGLRAESVGGADGGAIIKFVPVGQAAAAHHKAP